MHQLSSPNAPKLVREISGRSALPANGLGQPVALTGEDHNVGVVDQPVNQRSCQAVVPKDGVPLGELKVGCNNQALAFVAVGDHLKQQFSRILVQRNEANLVHHNQLHLFQRTKVGVQRALVVFLQKNVGKGRRREEPDPVTLLTCLERNGRGKMRLAGANRAHEDQVLTLREEGKSLHVFACQPLGQLNGIVPDGEKNFGGERYCIKQKNIF